MFLVYSKIWSLIVGKGKSGRAPLTEVADSVSAADYDQRMLRDRLRSAHTVCPYLLSSKKQCVVKRALNSVTGFQEKIRYKM
jgi:hypothetical protein